jgi:tetratricopeptide (TPR) repeat protein
MTAKPERKGTGPMSDKEQEFYAKKDYNNWIDNSYLLMGKAQLHKHEFDDARITFLHNIRESDDALMRYESTIWLARTYSEMGNNNETRRLLNELNSSVLTQTLAAEYFLTLADMHVKQENYEEAIPPLVSALENISGKKTKNRLTYILARLNEEVGNSNQASKHYRQVLKLNPPYEMAFNAKISQAGVFDVNSGDIKDIRKELRKLLRDSKNREYQDQIYYALGKLSMREGNIDEAINYFKMSAAASTVNPSQKGRSYLVLAEHYYAQSDYRQSQVYYDSTVSFLSNEYPGYEDFYGRSLNLNELTTYLEIIDREDSLQYVASLSPSERETIINQIIITVREEVEAEITELDTRYNMGEFYENQRRFRDNVDVSGAWYFYNQAALTFGRSEFRNRWGERPLEDNWRRANKTSTAMIQGENTEGLVQGDTINVLTDNKSREYYLRNLPLNDSLVALSDEMIAQALFGAGYVYYDRFQDVPRANESYNRLLERYPDHKLASQTLYNLYQTNKDNAPGFADRYKDQLINRYPNSEYAKILADPEYFNALIRSAERSEELYNRAYDAWAAEDISLTMSLCDSAISEFSTEEIIPRFMLLKAFASARITDERTFKEELTKIINLYPGTAESIRASEMVAYLNQEVPELKQEEEQEIARGIYNADTSGLQYFALVIKNNSLDMNRLTFDVINFNIDNYTNENYSTLGELVEDSYILVVVRSFPDSKTALSYYNQFNPQDILNNTGEAETLKFIISPANFETFTQDKNPDRYFLFFRENYLDVFN